MSTLFEGLDGVEVIMDDILVHGRNREEHDARLNDVLRINSDSGLKLNPKKCVFRKNDDYTDVVLLRLNETDGSECGCKQLRNRFCADAIH